MVSFQVTIYARKNAKEAGLIDFALEVAVESLNYFENVYFNISDAVPPKIGKHLAEPKSSFRF